MYVYSGYLYLKLVQFGKKARTKCVLIDLVVVSELDDQI